MNDFHHTSVLHVSCHFIVSIHALYMFCSAFLPSINSQSSQFLFCSGSRAYNHGYELFGVLRCVLRDVILLSPRGLMAAQILVTICQNG